jgi:hypothetical protein
MKLVEGELPQITAGASARRYKELLPCLTQMLAGNTAGESSASTPDIPIYDDRAKPPATPSIFF